MQAAEEQMECCDGSVSCSCFRCPSVLETTVESTSNGCFAREIPHNHEECFGRTKTPSDLLCSALNTAGEFRWAASHDTRKFFLLLKWLFALPIPRHSRVCSHEWVTNDDDVSRPIVRTLGIVSSGRLSFHEWRRNGSSFGQQQGWWYKIYELCWPSWTKKLTITRKIIVRQPKCLITHTKKPRPD